MIFTYALYVIDARGLIDNPFDTGNCLLNVLNAFFPTSKLYYTRAEVLADRDKQKYRKS